MNTHAFRLILTQTFDIGPVLDTPQHFDSLGRRAAVELVVVFGLIAGSTTEPTVGYRVVATTSVAFYTQPPSDVGTQS